MRLAPAQALLLALALIFGQWLVLAHAAEHPALANDINCELCLHVNHLDAGILPDSSPLVLTATYDLPLPAATPTPRAPRNTQYPIRGPPALS